MSRRAKVAGSRGKAPKNSDIDASGKDTSEMLLKLGKKMDAVEKIYW